MLTSKLLSTILLKLKALAPVSAGIDKKKDIFAASILLNFENLQVVIIIPDLLTPGIRDKTWNKPIKNIFFKFKSFTIFLF